MTREPPDPILILRQEERVMTKWGIIGAGEIARVFANGVRFSRTGRMVAVASRTVGRGQSRRQR